MAKKDKELDWYSINAKHVLARLTKIKKFIGAGNDDDSFQYVNVQGDGRSMVLSAYSKLKGIGIAIDVPESCIDGAFTLNTESFIKIFKNRTKMLGCLVKNQFKFKSETGKYSGELNTEEYQDISPYLEPKEKRVDFNSDSEFFKRMVEAYTYTAYKNKLAIDPNEDWSMLVTVDDDEMTTVCYDDYHIAKFVVDLKVPIDLKPFNLQVPALAKVIDLSKTDEFGVQVHDNYAVYITGKTVRAVLVMNQSLASIQLPLTVMNRTLENAMLSCIIEGEKIKQIFTNMGGVFEQSETIGFKIADDKAHFGYNTSKGKMKESFKIQATGKETQMKLSSVLIVDFASNFPNEDLKLVICGSTQQGKDLILQTRPNEDEGNRHMVWLIKGEMDDET